MQYNKLILFSNSYKHIPCWINIGWMNENYFTDSFREAPHFQMVPNNSHLSPRENIQSRFKRENLTQVSRKA